MELTKTDRIVVMNLKLYINSMPSWFTWRGVLERSIVEFVGVTKVGLFLSDQEIDDRSLVSIAKNLRKFLYKLEKNSVPYIGTVDACASGLKQEEWCEWLNNGVRDAENECSF